VDPTRIAIVGCGDVLYRHYLPALDSLGSSVDLVAFVDPRDGAAERAVHGVEDRFPRARAFTDLEAMLRVSGADAVIDLTPAPLHGGVNQTCLDAGLDVYSEKPIASSVAEADRLIETAEHGGRTLLCAPGVAVTERFRWLGEIVRSGRFGRLTLAVAQHADTGPATWREYTGDPTPFYADGVGPVFDHGVYRLHGLTTLLGPVRHVQAMGTISSPTRRVRGGPLEGRTIPVTTPDHVLMNLEFASGALGQLLTSFAAPATDAPWMELQFERGTVSLGGESSDKDASVRIFVDDESPLGLEGWLEGVRPPSDSYGTVEAGARHFVAVLRGEAEPILTAEHARHVLDIILSAYASIADRQTHEVSTTF